MNMTSNEKKIVAISAIVSVVVAAVFITYFFAKRLKNKERYSLLANANSDYIFWKGKTELQKAVSAILIGYWKVTGVNFSAASMQSASVHQTYPWSAAYISSVVLRSGFKNFKGRTTHASYVVDAKENRKSKLKPSYWAFKPSEQKKVELGDILVANRSGGTANLDNLTRSNLSHGDIVVDVFSKNGKKYATIQGGNVSNTVSRKNILLKSNQTLPTNTLFFAHLKYVK